MENKYEWKYTDIYKTKEDYKEDIKKVKEKLEEIVQYKGKLKDLSENIYKCYKIYEEIVEIKNYLQDGHPEDRNYRALHIRMKYHDFPCEVEFMDVKMAEHVVKTHAEYKNSLLK